MSPESLSIYCPSCGTSLPCGVQIKAILLAAGTCSDPASAEPASYWNRAVFPLTFQHTDVDHTQGGNNTVSFLREPWQPPPDRSGICTVTAELMSVRHGREQEEAMWMSPARTLGFRCCHFRGPFSRSVSVGRTLPTFLLAPLSRH